MFSSRTLKMSLLAVAVTVALAATACGNDAPLRQATDGSTDRGVPPPTATSVPLFSDFGIGDPLDTVPVVELAGIEGWINSPPLDLGELASAGQVVLLDFWTYTCVNCVRTFPFLKAMHAKYSDAGLTVIGVHSPEFEFEKDMENVRSAVEAAGLHYPVALDSEKVTWSAFGNRFWPTTYLVGADGEVTYRHFGEGDYAATETQIRAALERAGRRLAGIAEHGEYEPPTAPGAHTQTRELYAGYARGFDSGGQFAAQNEYYLGADETQDYRDTGFRRHDQFELQGRWTNESDAVRFAGSGPGGDAGYLVFPFLARSVNAVLSPPAGGALISVDLDGAPLDRESAGSDVRFDGAGRSYIDVSEPRMHRILDGAPFELSELRLTTESVGLRIHNFTFGVFEKGP